MANTQRQPRTIPVPPVGPMAGTPNPSARLGRKPPPEAETKLTDEIAATRLAMSKLDANSADWIKQKQVLDAKTALLKRHHTVRIAPDRVAKAEKALQAVGRLSNSGYNLKPEEIDTIEATLSRACAAAVDLLRGRKGITRKLSFDL